MKKNLFCLLLLSISSLSLAQVGINTEDPKATLDVVASENDPSKMDGIIAPRITGEKLRAKIYTNQQTGALVYVTLADPTPSGQTSLVTSAGYYYFNGNNSVNKWLKLSNDEFENWKTTGNLNTNLSKNFLGTLDNQPLVIKTNNVITGYIGSTSTSKPDRNIVFGEGSFDNVIDESLIAYNNVAIGYQALKNNTHSSNNIALGAYALSNQISGDNELRKKWGSNVAIGLRAMESSITSLWNVAIGELALGKLTTGWQNVAIGNRALLSATTAGRNTALGSEALSSLQTGNDNFAAGLYALKNIQTGTGNQSIGWSSGGTLTTGDHNIFMGYSVANTLLSGNRNFIVGHNVQAYNTNQNNQMNLGNLLYGIGFLSSGGIQKIGIATGISTPPKETLDVKGTAKISDLPLHNTSNSIYNGSDTKTSSFNATRTVVADDNGVLGTISGLPGNSNNSSSTWSSQTFNVNTSNANQTINDLTNESNLKDLYILNDITTGNNGYTVSITLPVNINNTNSNRVIRFISIPTQIPYNGLRFNGNIGNISIANSNATTIVQNSYISIGSGNRARKETIITFTEINGKWYIDNSVLKAN
ncbi:hypothetical protein [Empedobacter brevis]